MTTFVSLAFTIFASPSIVVHNITLPSIVAHHRLTSKCCFTTSSRHFGPLVPCQAQRHLNFFLRQPSIRTVENTGHRTWHRPWALSICGWSSVELDRFQSHGFWILDFRHLDSNSGKHWAPDMAPGHGRSSSADDTTLSSIGLNIMELAQGVVRRPQGPLERMVGKRRIARFGYLFGDFGLTARSWSHISKYVQAVWNLRRLSLAYLHWKALVPAGCECWVPIWYAEREVWEDQTLVWWLGWWLVWYITSMHKIRSSQRASPRYDSSLLNSFS